MQQMIRQIALACVILFSLLFLLGRLAYIQFISPESFSKHKINLVKGAVQQRQQSIALNSGRGHMTDRDGFPLTGKQVLTPILFPFVGKHELTDYQWERLEQLLEANKAELQLYFHTISEPTVFQYQSPLHELTHEQAEELNKLQIPGLIAAPYEQRFDKSERLAQHLIGYLGQNAERVRSHYPNELQHGLLQVHTPIGISGLEKTFQHFLQSADRTKLAYYVDGMYQPLLGINMLYSGQENPFYPLSIQTTLSSEWQRAIEASFRRTGVKQGAAVFIDIASSEVLAMASMPNYMNHLNIEHAWENKALKRYSPGSVFKVVVAAAALEEGLVKPRDTFECKGHIPGTDFHCWLAEGHGRLSFAEAFEQSCNITFGELAAKLGGAKLEEYADKLGLLAENGWHGKVFYDEHFSQLDREEIGQVFSPLRQPFEKNDREYLLRAGIGQLDVQLTPLALANMMATLTRSGKKQQVKVVQAINYHNGSHYYQFKKQQLEGEKISPYTAYQLHKLLTGVVRQGTASELREAHVPIAGKTGTAQATNNAGQIKANHHWFVGYYPVNNPQVAFAIVALEESENQRGSQALKVLKETLKQIEK